MRSMVNIPYHAQNLPPVSAVLSSQLRRIPKVHDSGRRQPGFSSSDLVQALVMALLKQKVVASVQFSVRLRHHDLGCDLEGNAEFVMSKMGIAVSSALQVAISLRAVRKHRGLLLGMLLSYCLFWLSLGIIRGCYDLLVASVGTCHRQAPLLDFSTKFTCDLWRQAPT